MHGMQKMTRDMDMLECMQNSFSHRTLFKYIFLPKKLSPSFEEMLKQFIGCSVTARRSRRGRRDVHIAR